MQSLLQYGWNSLSHPDHKIHFR